MKIVVDAMGGDYAPKVVVDGAERLREGSKVEVKERDQAGKDGGRPGGGKGARPGAEKGKPDGRS